MAAKIPVHLTYDVVTRQLALGAEVDPRYLIGGAAVAAGVGLLRWIFAPGDMSDLDMLEAEEGRRFGSLEMLGAQRIT